MMGKHMHGLARVLAPCLLIAASLAQAFASMPANPHLSRPKNFQETGFLNRTLELKGTLYRFQVYLP